jgi:hypothetical protein
MSEGKREIDTSMRETCSARCSSVVQREREREREREKERENREPDGSEARDQRADRTEARGRLRR